MGAQESDREGLEKISYLSGMLPLPADALPGMKLAVFTVVTVDTVNIDAKGNRHGHVQSSGNIDIRKVDLTSPAWEDSPEALKRGRDVGLLPATICPRCEGPFCSTCEKMQQCCGCYANDAKVEAMRMAGQTSRTG